MKYISLIIVFLFGCTALEPDYVELGGGVEQGGITHGRNGSYDTGAEWVGVTLGWNLGVQSKAMRNLADLDVSRAGELSFRDSRAESSIIINNKKESTPTEDTDTIPEQLAPTKTKEESYAFLLWAAGILVLAGAAVLLGKSGVKLPFLNKPEK